MYRGFSISLFCIPVFNTIYFPMYEHTKQNIKFFFNLKEGDISLYSGSAAIAGIICNIVTNPLWMIRTRMQSEIFHN
jgi:solute carrier family 25 folate transporter 32